MQRTLESIRWLVSLRPWPSLARWQTWQVSKRCVLLTFNRNVSMLLLFIQRRNHGSSSRGSSARHNGPDCSANASRHGPAAWVRHRRARPAGFRGSAQAEPGNPVSCPAAPRAEWLDLFQMGCFGKQSQGEVLLAHARRAQTITCRDRELAAYDRADGAPSRRYGRSLRWTGYAFSRRVCAASSASGNSTEISTPSFWRIWRCSRVNTFARA